MERGFKRIVIFGATGNTGLVTTQYAIENGYIVSVFVRNPTKIPADVKPYKVFIGDVLNADVVSAAIQGQDAVVVTLGTRNDLTPTTVLSDGLKNIIQGMVKYGVKRITCCISSFLFWERSKVPEPYIPITEDHERMLNVLKSSDRDWTALYPPHISDDQPLGKYELKNNQPVGRIISKYDLGEIMIKCLDDKERIGQVVGMGYPQP